MKKFINIIIAIAAIMFLYPVLVSANIDFSGGLLDGKPLGNNYNATDNNMSTSYNWSGEFTPSFIFEKPVNIVGYRYYTTSDLYASKVAIIFYVGDNKQSVTITPANRKGEFVNYEINDVREIKFYNDSGYVRYIHEFNVYGTYVASLPPKVEGVTVSNITHNEADVVWNSIEDAEKYKIYLNNTLIGETTNNMYKITSLNPDTNYTIRITAVNEEGEGQPSDPVSFRTLPLPVPSKVQNVVVKNITHTSALISWDANPESEGVLKYIVYLNNKKQGETTNTEYLLDNLQPATTYNVLIEAVNVYGAGPQADLVVFTTLEIPPEPATQVRDLRIKSMTSTSALISWSPNPLQEKIIKYIVYVNGKKQGETEGTEYVLEGLKEGERYTVAVSAVNALGEGPLSASVLLVPTRIADISKTIKVQDIFSSIATLFVSMWPLTAFIIAVIAMVPITRTIKQTITRGRSNNA